jgi:8-oxo-dGTP diphosphatase
MQSKVVAKAVILNGDGLVLMLRRSSTDARRPGTWDFPGGGIEPDEEIIAGVCREVCEEAGLTILPTAFALAYAATEPWQPEHASVTRLLFVTHVSGQPAVTLSFEHDQFKWVDVATALADFPHPFYSAGLSYAATYGLLA